MQLFLGNLIAKLSGQMKRY